MPVLRYFMWVGGSLLALLLMADFYLPKQPQRTEAPHSYNIAIAAAPHPDSQAIMFSGETHNFGAPPPMTVVDFDARANDATQTATPAMQAHAQMTGAPTAKPSHRQKVAKRKIKRQRDMIDHDVARLPDAWHRDQPMGLAFARPFFW